jgi:hypothetical protein
MGDAQAWTLIAGFFALMVTMIGMTLRVVKAEIGVLAARIDHLDRDIQAVMTRLMDG